MVSQIEWTNQDVLYHGTDAESAATIRDRGVKLEAGQLLRDFSRGFYTTTSYSQALDWATRRALRLNLDAVVLRYEVSRDELATFDTIAFVKGDEESSSFWTFVHHCRAGRSAHGRGLNGGWYDVVIGPVTTIRSGVEAILTNSDQFSFHTERALSSLRLTD